MDSLVLDAERRTEGAGPSREWVEWAGCFLYHLKPPIPGLPTSQHMMVSEKAERDELNGVQCAIRPAREEDTGPASRGTWKAFCA